MPLLTLWRSAPDTISAFNLAQIVSAAGEGDLRDDSICSSELRAYLREVTTERLSAYVDQCLAQAHAKGGYILQDLVNERGRRLGYEVQDGLYAGRMNQVGFDGLWTFTGQPSVIVEVKTTDAYRISLDTIVGYRDRLVQQGRCGGDASILIVVGRQDTGELEAQIRGSRHAWDVRLISAEALLRLADIKVGASSPETDGKIRGLLKPTEYTRLDGLVDVVFSAARDVEGRAEPEPELTVIEEQGAALRDMPRQLDMTSPADLAARRRSIVDRWAFRHKSPLIATSRALYRDSAHRERVACTISKRYPNVGRPYWYAFHPTWRTFLSEGEQGHILLGMMDQSRAFAVPLAALERVLPHLNVTEKPDNKTYWHLHVLRAASGEMSLYVPGQDAMSLEEFSFDLD